jgi:hypothetical protein
MPSRSFRDRLRLVPLLSLQLPRNGHRPRLFAPAPNSRQVCRTGTDRSRTNDRTGRISAMSQGVIPEPGRWVSDGNLKHYVPEESQETACKRGAGSLPEAMDPSLTTCPECEGHILALGLPLFPPKIT